MGALPIKRSTKPSLLGDAPASQSPQHGLEESWRDEGSRHGRPSPSHPHSAVGILGDNPRPLDNKRSERLHGRHTDSPQDDSPFRTRDVDLRSMSGSDHSLHWDDNQRVMGRDSGRGPSWDEHRDGNERLGDIPSRVLPRFGKGAPDDGELPFGHTDQDDRVPPSGRERDYRGRDHDSQHSRDLPPGDMDYRRHGRGPPDRDSHRGPPHPDDRRGYSREGDYRARDSDYGLMDHDYGDSDYRGVNRGGGIPFRGRRGIPPPPHPGMHGPRMGGPPRGGPPRGGGGYRGRGGPPRGGQRGRGNWSSF